MQTAAAAMQLRGALWRPPMRPVAAGSWLAPRLRRHTGRRWCCPKPPELAEPPRLGDSSIPGHQRPAVSAAPAAAPAAATLGGHSSPSVPPDHRHLATEQQLFITDPVSPGSPLFLPNGARVFHKLQEFLRAQYAYYGFEEVLTPTIYKRALWETSGHWEKYGKDMFVVTGRGASGTGGNGGGEEMEIGQDEEYGLKPMNCPGHCLLFKSATRSHRDLPVRYADFSPLHRYVWLP